MKRSFINSISSVAKLLVLGVVLVASALHGNAQVTVTATGAGPGPVVYPVAGGLRLAFAAINAGTHTGAITITVSAGGTNEGATAAVLNANAAPASYTSVLIKPAVGANPTIAGNVANNGTIFLFGATNVTIDGSNAVGGTTQNLTINNLSANGAVIRMGNNVTTGASSNTIKNSKLLQANPINSAVILYSGNGVGAMIPISAAGVANDNNTVENNNFSNAQTGILAWGPLALESNWNIRNNVFTTLGFTGIQLNNSLNSNITDNVISDVTINGNSAVSGIVLSWACNNVTIARNKITNINNTYGFGIMPVPPPVAAAGIYLTVSTATSSANIYNNFISDVRGVGHANLITNGWGIIQNFLGTFNIHHNSLKQFTAQATGTSANIFVGPGAGGSISLLDNLIINSQGSGGNRYALYCAVAPAIFSAINYNDYFSISGTLGFVGGLPRANMAAMIAGFGGNAQSIDPPIDPLFISVSDLHLQTNPINFPLAAGTPVAGVTQDIDATNRSALTPTLGAHELANKITYTVIPTVSCHSDFDTLTPVKIESPSGVPLGGGFAARIYYKKTVGPWVSVAGTPLTGATATMGDWRFIMDYSLLGGVVAGDVISYYVVAQTIGGVVFSSPVAGFTAVDVNTVTSAPTTPSTLNINAVTLVGLITSNDTCFNPTLAQSMPYHYTGTTGAPNQYTLTWSPPGPIPTPLFVPLPASPINVNLPAGIIAAPYNGVITIRNSTNGCSNNYYITLTVNPLPGTITGPLSLCGGTTAVLGSPSPGGMWTSSMPTVATIGATTGFVTAMPIGGTTTISYTLPTGCGTFANLNVVAPPAPIVGPSAVCPNLTITLTNSTPGGVWSSSAPATGSIDPVTGVLTGLAPGTLTVIYTISGCTPVNKPVTVNSTPQPITASPSFFVCAGLTTTLNSLSATIPASGTWSSGDLTVATVGSTSGVLTGVSGGSVPVTYTQSSTGCIITNTVIVNPAPGPITGSPIICQYLSVTLSNSLPGGTWTSSLPGVIGIDLNTGVATAYTSSGTATISYIVTATGCRTHMVMTISTPPTSIAGSQVVCSEYTLSLSNGTAGGTWTSADPSIATVGSSSGIVTGIIGGTTTISYVTTACNPVVYTITVNQTPPPITGGITLCHGENTTTVFNSMAGGAWTISGPASISPVGVITGLTIGATNIVTYTVATGCYRTAPIIVDTLPAPIQGPDDVCQGRSIYLTTASTGGLWSSNNAVIASVIADTGKVTGVNHGATTITYAALSGCYVTKPFTVINPLPAAVTLTRNPPAPDTLCLGTPTTFTAHPVNGGLVPNYQWQNFGVNIPGATNVTYSYVPVHGDVIRVFMYNSLDICAAPTPAYVDMPLNIYPSVSPAIVISTSAVTTTSGSNTYATMSYLGQVVTFFSLVTAGGSNVTYQWYVDGVAVPGATNNSFAHTAYDDDEVYCVVNGNPVCETGSLGTSNKIFILADYLQTNTVTGVKSALSLFPNPNTGSFTLTGTLGANSNEELAVDVMNVLGQVIHSGTATAKNGAVSYQVALDKDVKPGTYMLRVNSKSESKVFHFVVGE